MELRLIRNATLRLHYGGAQILIDPMLGVRHSTRPLAGVPGRNPTVDLPCPIDEVIDGAELVVFSHLHPDHYDDATKGVLPRGLPILCRAGDEEALREAGFEQVDPLTGPVARGGVSITPTEGSHGHGAVAERMGGVIGLVLQAEGEPTVYWAGDTVWCDAVADTIERERPNVIITHSGGAAVGDVPIIMTADHTVQVCGAAPEATVVAVHLEAMAHCPVTRAGLRAAATAAGVDERRLRIPADGETLAL